MQSPPLGSPALKTPSRPPLTPSSSSSSAMSALLSDPKVWEQKITSLRRVTEEDRQRAKKEREKERMKGNVNTLRPMNATDMIACALARKFQFARGSPLSSPESSSDWDSASDKENAASPSSVGPRRIVLTDLAASPLRTASPVPAARPALPSPVQLRVLHDV